MLISYLIAYINAVLQMIVLFLGIACMIKYLRHK